MRIRRSSRSVPAVVVAVSCLLAGGTLTGAEAKPSLQLPNLLGHSQPTKPTQTSNPSTTQRARSTALDTSAAKPGLPYQPPGPPNYWTPRGGKIDKTTQTVKKAKVTFDLPKQTVLAWIHTEIEQPVGPLGWLDATGQVYVTSPKGARGRFGTFPTVTTKLLAFGAVPVSADVHITQIRKANGDPDPLILSVRFTGSPKNPPSPLPCSPPTQEINQCQYTDAPKLRGSVDVRIDNVVVDGVAIDVGRNCHTATPATLDLGAPAGYYSLLTSPQYIPDNLYLPFFAGGTLQGAVNVPSFTGCQDGSADLSPLFTAAVSGPDNNLIVHQDGPLEDYPPK